MTDLQTPPPPQTSLSAAARPVQPQLSAGTKTFVTITSLLLFSVTFLTALPDRETGRSNPISEVAGQSIGAVLFALAIALGAYKGVKPTQSRVFLGTFGVSAAFVLLSALG